MTGILTIGTQQAQAAGYGVGIAGSYIATAPIAPAATSTTPRTVPASKKGLLIDPAKLGNAELTDLGVKHAIISEIKKLKRTSWTVLAVAILIAVVFSTTAIFSINSINQNLNIFRYIRSQYQAHSLRYRILFQTATLA